MRADPAAIANTRERREGAEPDRISAHAQLWRVCLPNRCAPAGRKGICGPVCYRGRYLAWNAENGRGARCHHPGDDDTRGRGGRKGASIL